MSKKVVVLGAGTGMSALVKGLKHFPVEISTIVSVCDDGKSTGILRREFNTPAVGDLRKVIVALSETEPLVGELLNYRFEATSELNGHTVGNLLLTALKNITGNMSKTIESLSSILKLKGKVIPLTEDNVILMAKTKDGAIIEGEHNITADTRTIDYVFYKDIPKVNDDAIKAIAEADLIIISMGSIYTSIMPNLICKEIIEAIDKNPNKIMYICNMMTQPGETDDFSASDHIKKINGVLGTHKIEVVIANNGEIIPEIASKYQTQEQKNPVIFDKEEVLATNVELFYDDFVTIENAIIRYEPMKLALQIFSYLINK